MDLPRRMKDDVHLPDGTFREAINKLRQLENAHDLRVVIAYAFDFRTRMLPYWYADKRMAPCSVRTLADCLDAAGFKHVRIVLQQWTPNFRPSMAELDGKPVDLMLVSAMQVHAEPSYDLIRDAHRLGDKRPLILAGGPKAIYEPTDYFDLGPEKGIGADCVATGEAYVLLDFLLTVLEHKTPDESARAAFDRVRTTGELDRVLGLVYLAPDAPPDRPVAVNTGVQRLLRDLDELPMPDAGYRLLEPPHRKRELAAHPYPPRKVGKRSQIASIIASQGCKFKCTFCPIPAANQRTWRHKSPERFAAEIKHIHENFGIVEFFGTDDNFFNKRETVVSLMTELAKTTTGGLPLGRHVRFYTEGTQHDVFKNRDILPLCRTAGLRAIWFGIEDITGSLVNKGQNDGHVKELFTLMQKLRIEPMAMMIHSDDQPLRSKKGDLAGLLNQARYMFDIGAVSYQCTYLGPAVGSRDIEQAAKDRILFKNVGGVPVPQAFQDGNHVVASRHDEPWQKERNVLRAYWTFYNPINFLRVLSKIGRDPLFAKRLLFQIVGHIGLVFTAPKMTSWANRLKRGPIEVWDGLVPARIPMVDAVTGEEVQWAVEHMPAKDLPKVYRPRAAAIAAESEAELPAAHVA